MAGTVEGGRKAAAKNLAKDPDFYKRIGRKGGSKPTPNGGFGSLNKDKNGLTGPQRAKIYGTKGGRISRRRKSS